MQALSQIIPNRLEMLRCSANTSVISFQVKNIYCCTLAFEYLLYIIDNPTGKLTDNGIITEGLFSLSNLMVLFNDQVIRRELLKGQPRNTRNDTEDSIKLFLTVLENVEVLIEITSKKTLGKKKFIIIFLIQAVK